MRRLFVAGLLASGFVPAATLVDSLEAQQLSGSVPQSSAALGTIELPRRVMADGQGLDAGSYDVQLTEASATPPAVGALGVLERWVEFRQEGDVKGRELVTIAPKNEIADVAKSAPPGDGTSRIELLRENEYLRVWINQDGTHYLIHLSVG